jgi:hypothetical protein
VKTCIAFHLIASLHMECERRYMMLYAVYSIYEDIYLVVAYYNLECLSCCLIKYDLNNLLKQFAC